MEYTVDEVYGLSRNIPLNYVERHDVDERLRCNLNRDKHITNLWKFKAMVKTCLRKHCLNENDYILDAVQQSMVIIGFECQHLKACRI